MKRSERVRRNVLMTLAPANRRDGLALDKLAFLVPSRDKIEEFNLGHMARCGGVALDSPNSPCALYGAGVAMLANAHCARRYRGARTHVQR